MKLYLDDMRPVPDGWELVRTYHDAIYMLKCCDVTEISLDHDLGSVKSGYDVLNWIEAEAVLNPSYKPPKIYIHTANPSARIKMELGKSAIEKFQLIKESSTP